MRRLALLLGLIALAIGLSLLAWRDWAQRRALMPVAALEAQGKADLAILDSVIELPDSASDDREAAVEMPTSPPPVRAIDAPRFDRIAKITGRFVRPSAAPIQGVQMMRTGGEREEDELGISSEDGRFTLTLKEANPFPLSLRAHFPGYVVPRWDWDRIAPGAAIELGTLVLIREALLRVRVLTEDGQSLTPDVLVFATAEVESHRGDVPFIYAEALTGSTSGDCLLEGLPPETVFVSATSPLFSPIGPEPVKLFPGIVTEATLIYRGPPLDQRIYVALPESEALASRVLLEEVRLRGPDGEELIPRRAGDANRGLVFDGLTENDYLVFLKGDRWRPWSQSGVNRESDREVESRRHS